VRLGGRESHHPHGSNKGEDGESNEECALLDQGDDGSTQNVSNNLASHHENPKDGVEEAFVGIVGAKCHVTSKGNPQETCSDSSNNGAQADEEANEAIHVLEAVI